MPNNQLLSKYYLIYAEIKETLFNTFIDSFGNLTPPLELGISSGDRYSLFTLRDKFIETIL